MREFYIPPFAKARRMGHPEFLGWWERKQVPLLRFGMTNKGPGNDKREQAPAMAEENRQRHKVQATAMAEQNMQRRKPA
jgi:hypothetical protein